MSHVVSTFNTPRKETKLGANNCVINILIHGKMMKC